MRLRLDRFYLAAEYTLGFLTVEGDSGHACFTLEDAVRAEKIRGVTAIPAGEYPIKLRNEGGMSPRYALRFGESFHHGMLWLQDVPNFQYVYIHPGNTDEDTEGCILVGEGATLGTLQASTAAYTKLYPAVAAAVLAGQDVRITVIDHDAR